MAINIEETRILLLEKRKQMVVLGAEIRELENTLIGEEWRNKPVCECEYDDISKNKCIHGRTFHGIIYCKHPHCGK